MKKVLVIAPYAYLPWRSGGQKFIAQFLQYLGKQTELTVVSVAENDASQAGRYRLIPLLKKGFSRYYDLSLVKKISALVKEQAVDTIIWEHPYMAWLAFRVRKKTGVKTLIHTHNIEYQRFRSTGRWWWPILKYYERWCFKKADGIFFITPEDRQFAIRQWKIAADKCFELPFGIELKEHPTDRARCRETIVHRHGIAPGEKILLFTGALAYPPNLQALQLILDKINPLLMQHKGFAYKILVCGGGLPPALNNLEGYRDQHLLYAGFSADIDVYYKAADLFLNPVLSGGGIKTKMVESIAFGTTVISTQTGAIGIDRELCGNKLLLIADDDIKGFADKVFEQSQLAQEETPLSYYQQYHWESIIAQLLKGAI